MNQQNMCVSDLELAAYFDGTLPPAEKEMIARHLSEHRDCRCSAGIMKAVLAAEQPAQSAEVPEQLVQQAMALHPGRRDKPDIVLSFLQDALSVVSTAVNVQLFMPAAPAPVRNFGFTNPSLIVIRKTFDAIVAEASIEKLAGNRCNISILVSNRISMTGGSLRVDLNSGGRELASSLLENGRVLFEDVARGQYLIVIHKKGTALGTLVIHIG